MLRWAIGLMLSVCALVVWPSSGFSAGHEDQPFALETVASYLPLSPADVRIGAGLAFRPANPNYPRLDVIQHDVGLTLCHRVRLAQVIDLSLGVTAYYDFSASRVVPGVTVGRILF